MNAVKESGGLKQKLFNAAYNAKRQAIANGKMQKTFVPFKLLLMLTGFCGCQNTLFLSSHYLWCMGISIFTYCLRPMRVILIHCEGLKIMFFRITHIINHLCGSLSWGKWLRGRGKHYSVQIELPNWTDQNQLVWFSFTYNILRFSSKS